MQLAKVINTFPQRALHKAYLTLNNLPRKTGNNQCPFLINTYCITICQAKVFPGSWENPILDSQNGKFPQLASHHVLYTVLEDSKDSEIMIASVLFCIEKYLPSLLSRCPLH